MDLRAVGGDAGRVLFGDEGKLRVHEDVGAHVNGVLDCGQDVAKDVDLRGVGFDGFDARGGLERIGRVDDEDPVAVAEEGHGLREILVCQLTCAFAGIAKATEARKIAARARGHLRIGSSRK